MLHLEPHGPDVFVGVGPRYPWGGFYGGQIIAQGLRAAAATVEAGWPCSFSSFSSMRAAPYFLPALAGLVGLPAAGAAAAFGGFGTPPLASGVLIAGVTTTVPFLAPGTAPRTSSSQDAINASLLVQFETTAETLLVDGRINPANAATCLPNSGAVAWCGALNRMHLVERLIKPVLTVVAGHSGWSLTSELLATTGASPATSGAMASSRRGLRLTWLPVTSPGRWAWSGGRTLRALWAGRGAVLGLGVRLQLIVQCIWKGCDVALRLLPVNGVRNLGG